MADEKTGQLSLWRKLALRGLNSIKYTPGLWFLNDGIRGRMINVYRNEILGEGNLYRATLETARRHGDGDDIRLNTFGGLLISTALMYEALVHSLEKKPQTGDDFRLAYGCLLRTANSILDLRQYNRGQATAYATATA